MRRGDVSLTCAAVMLLSGAPCPVVAAVTRVSFLDPQRSAVYGKLVAVTENAVIVQRSEGTNTDSLSLTSVALVETEAGRRVRGRNVFAGVLVGTVAGAIAAGISFARENSGAEDNGIGVLVTGTSIGASVGLVFGCIPVRTWHDVWVSEAVRDRRARMQPWP